MRNDDNDLRSLGPALVDHLLHVVVLNAKGPVGHKMAWVGNRCVREGLSDHGHGDAVLLANDVGFEDWVTKVIGLNVLGQEFDLASEILFNDLHDTVRTIGELPVGTHHVNTQQLGGVDHVLTVGPQRCGRALPGVTTIDQEGMRTAGPHHLDQRGHVGKAAHLAIGLGGLFEVQVGVGMRQG